MDDEPNACRRLRLKLVNSLALVVAFNFRNCFCAVTMQHLQFVVSHRLGLQSPNHSAMETFFMGQRQRSVQTRVKGQVHIANAFGLTEMQLKPLRHRLRRV